MGTKFSLKNPNPGVWFPFNEEDPNSGRICVRVLNAAQTLEIDKATVKRGWEYRNGTRYSTESIDQEKRSKMLWDYTIVDWQRLEDDEGNPIECTPENKYRLMQEHLGFSTFVGTCISRLNSEYEAERDRIEKNLSSISRGN